MYDAKTTFTGKNAEIMREQFRSYYWDGGLEDTIENNFLNEYSISSDDTIFHDSGVIVKTDNAKL